MRILPFFAVATVLLALPVLLAGCESLGLNSKPKSAADLACPRVETPSALSIITQGGDTPLQLKLSGNLRVRDTKCDVGDMVKLSTKVELAATRGPALVGEEAKVPFFAAVLAQDGTLLSKKLYETTFDFGSAITDRETVVIDFTLTRAQAASARIYVGYQLNREAFDALGANSATQP